MATEKLKLGPVFQRIEVSPLVASAYEDLIIALGCEDRGGFYDAAEVQAVLEKVGTRDEVAKLLIYAIDLRHGGLSHLAVRSQLMNFLAALQSSRALSEIGQLAAEVRELARVAAMPTKLVKGEDGRTIGAVKTPKLIGVVKH